MGETCIGYSFLRTHLRRCALFVNSTTLTNKIGWSEHPNSAWSGEIVGAHPNNSDWFCWRRNDTRTVTINQNCLGHWECNESSCQETYMVVNEQKGTGNECEAVHGDVRQCSGINSCLACLSYDRCDDCTSHSPDDCYWNTTGETSMCLFDENSEYSKFCPTSCAFFGSCDSCQANTACWWSSDKGCEAIVSNSRIVTLHYGDELSVDIYDEP
eukprot:UN34284